MKKFFYLSVVLLGGLVVGSCSGDDDDDNGGGKGSSSAGVIDSRQGILLKSVDNFRFFYTDNGRLDYFTEDNRDRYEMGSNTINFVNEDGEEEEIELKYNGSGFLTTIKDSYSFTEERLTVNFSGKATLSYDGSGHLTKISLSSTEKGVEDGKSYTETSTNNISFSWRSNLLTSVESLWKEVEDENVYTGSEWYHYEYNDAALENNVNKYCQYAPSIVRWGEDLWRALAYVGMLGVGPNCLPSGCEYGYEDYEDGKLDEEYKNTESYRYQFNSDGTLSVCYRGSRSYNFSYYYMNADARATRSGADLAKSMRSLFRRHAKGA